jgi:pimeloyl-ACP methyl ester carboxylesterase
MQGGTRDMLLQDRDIQTGYVTTEGDDLYYEVRGHGPPLVMIPAASGDAGLYAFVADSLCDEYKVITYDRRGYARSTRHEPQNFEISQQSRDALAVLHSVGERAAFVFGSSSGAIFALDLAKTQPDVIKAVVAHEPPVARVLPDSERWLRFFAGLYWVALRLSVNFAMLRFALMVGIPALLAMRKAPQDVASRTDKVADFFVRHELLPVVNYQPDCAQIRQNGVRVVMAAGQWSLDKHKFYARTVPILAERLGCEIVTFPGHHSSYVDKPKEWAATLRSILHRAGA